MSLRPSGNQLWKKHVQIYTAIFRQALLALSKIQTLINENEQTISLRLSELVQQKCFEYDKDLAYPIYEPLIMTKMGKKNKQRLQSGRPDFSCRLKNRYAQSYAESELDFHIECKCLGIPSNPSWIFNKNYVNKGIMRFDLKDKRYGENVSDGMMIGYVTSMSPDDICKEINAELIQTGRNFPPISFPPSPVLLRETTQQIKRIVIAPSDFTLIHLWVVF